MNGFATIAVTPAEQITTITRLRDRWTSLGYEITEFRTFAPVNKRGTVWPASPPTR